MYRAELLAETANQPTSWTDCSNASVVCQSRWVSVGVGVGVLLEEEDGGRMNRNQERASKSRVQNGSIVLPVLVGR
jgi:hypothetical protein